MSQDDALVLVFFFTNQSAGPISSVQYDMEPLPYVNVCRLVNVDEVSTICWLCDLRDSVSTCCGSVLCAKIRF